jgi:hypothetical protein
MNKLILAVLMLTLSLTLSCASSGGGGGGGGGNTTTYDLTIIVTGDNNSNGVYDAPLDNVQFPLNGDEDIFCIDSETNTLPANAPQMFWDSSIHAYTHNRNDLSVAKLNDYWVLVAEPDPGSGAPAGSLSPVTGVFLQVTDKDGYACTDILVHLVIVGEDALGNYVYGYQILGVNPDTGCVVQGADNRSVIFGI